MGRTFQDTTAAGVLAAYEAVVSLATSAAPSSRSLDDVADDPAANAGPSLAEEARRMRAVFQKRTGTYGPEDAWFEARSRAFWDDAVTTQGFARMAAPLAGEDVSHVVARWGRAHRGVFLVEEVDDRGAHLRDLWSGAELLVRHLDEAQATTLEHAEGAMDARIVAGPAEAEAGHTPALYMLPGALHHGLDAMEPLAKVIAAARERDMKTEDVLDALLRMELVLRSSSRVKAGFAYRVESLPRVL